MAVEETWESGLLQFELVSGSNQIMHRYLFILFNNVNIQIKFCY